LEAELRRHAAAPGPRHAARTPIPRSRRRAVAAATTLSAVPSTGRSAGERIVSSTVTGLRRSVRSLGRTPVVTLAALICLALGMGATTAIFSAVNTALLRPLPFTDPASLVTVYRTTPHFNTGPFSAANFLDLRANTKSLEQLAAVASNAGLIESEGGSARVPLYQVSGNLFPMLGVSALRGRLLTRADEGADRPDVVVLSEELWRDRYGAEAATVGTALTINGKPHEVIGIMPRGFRVPHGGESVAASLWVPLRFTPEQAAQRRSNYLRLLGRVQPSQTVEGADRELRAVMDQIVASFPDLRGESIRTVPLAGESVRAVKRPLLLLLGAVGFVLLIAAANVASLLLARGAERGREVAIRSALGASRGAILGQVLRESLVLAGAGSALGLLLGWASVRAIGTVAARILPQLAGLSIDLRVLLFAGLVTGLVAVLCGILPAWRASKTDPQEALRSGGARIGAGAAHHRFLRGLIVTEVALALVLLLGAGLVLRGFMRLISRDPGFDPKPLLTLVTNVSSRRYENADSYRQFLTPALEAIKRVPGVAEAGSITLLPYHNWGNNSNVRYEGRAEVDQTRMPLVEYRRVTPSFFPTLGMTLLKGRLLTDADRISGAPQVVVVNRALMVRDFSGQDPIGKRFYTSDTTFATIVGMVADIRNAGPFNDPQPEMYWPYEPGYAGFPIVVRVTGADPAAVVKQVTDAIHAVDPTAAVSLARPMEAIIAQSVGQPRFYMTLLGAFAGVALLLSLAGLYGLTSYAVATRTREIGIRTALGATPAQSVALVIRDGAFLVGGGLLVGGLLGLAITRLLGGLLFGVSPLDLPAWAIVSTALGLVGMLATFVPARRASRIDPLIAIRSD
ncbi:MAG: ABC transporter permease, partial [Gemmatimonadales bacterium]|nr:ABC transporter permease [Gemmatimonadales bacterium]